MTTIYVARSVKLNKWASDVGLGKHAYKVGLAEEGELKELIAKGWAGETDWQLVQKADAPDGLAEPEVIERLARKLKMVDPNHYPRIKGTPGIYKVLPDQVENHIVITRALAGTEESVALKLKPVDFGNFLIHNAWPR